MAKKTPKRAPKVSDPRKIYPAIFWACMAGAWLLVAVALASHDAADPLSPGTLGGTVAPFNTHYHNFAGRIGADTASADLFLPLVGLLTRTG